MQPALERLFERMVFGPEVDPAKPEEVKALLARCELPEEDSAAVAEDFARLSVYRKLVRGTLREAIELAIPRTIFRLGGLFQEYFDRFLDQRGPRTHFLRDVTPEFLDFCAGEWKADARVPPWMSDLARHESLRIEIGAMPTLPPPEDPEELALDRGVRFTEASALMRYDFAVQRLSADEQDLGEPAREPTMLFVYRSPDHEVRYLELSPLAHAILRGLRDERLSLRAALERAVAELGVPLVQGVLEGSARLLADLAERGALLGAVELVKDCQP